jgi:hypothetical protein
MRPGVDAAREPGDDEVPFAAELSGQPLREGSPGCRGISRTDDRDGRAGKGGRVAADRDQRRGGVDRLEGARVIGLALGDEDGAKPAQAVDLALGLRAGRNLETTAAAAASQVRQRLKRSGGAPELVDKSAEGARADPLAADEAKLTQPLLIAQLQRATLSARSGLPCRP